MSSASETISAAARALESSRGQALFGISISTTILAMTSCAVRFLVRNKISRGIWWDDYAIVAATVMANIGMIFTSIESSSLNDRIRAMQFDYLSQPWLMFGSSLAKISICFYFLRTIGRRRPWNLLLGCLVVLLAMVNLAFALTSNLQCRPLEKLWNPTVDGQCFDAAISLNIGYFQESFAVFTYFFLAIFPIVIVRDMEVLKSIRWPFYVLSFSMLTSAIFSIIRTYQTSVIGASPVFSADVLLTTIFATLIQNLTIIAANILPLGPLFSPKARDLSRLVATSDNELEVQTLSATNGISQTSNRSSFISVKRSTTLIIEGPRKMGDELPPGTTLQDLEDQAGRYDMLRPDTSHAIRPGTAVSTGGEAERNNIVAMQMGQAHEAGWGAFDAEAFNKGILRTISVEVVEEDVTDAERGEIKVNDEDWKRILRDGPRH